MDYEQYDQWSENARLAREEYVQGKLTAEEFLRKIDITHELTSYEAGKIDLPDEPSLWQRLVERDFRFDLERHFPDEKAHLDLSYPDAQWQILTADDQRRKAQKGEASHPVRYPNQSLRHNADPSAAGHIVVTVLCGNGMFTIAANVFEEDFSQSFTVILNFVPMMHQANKDEVFIAEKTTFDSLATFLRAEFYRGLAAGNAPRRCHNCGVYFLLDSGYNTIYCNNIAPGETDRTCRKVGAHLKEAREKANCNPARVEYDRTYNRLKQKKNRKKISPNEWHASVAEAMRILEQSESGEFTDDEMRTRFKSL